MTRTRILSISNLIVLMACADGEIRKGQPSGDDSADTADTGEPGPVVEGCRATPPAADRDRLVVAALPYDADGGQADTWIANRLDTEGVLHPDGTLFTMGRANYGTVAFTPDAQVGFAAQDDGTIGVFTTAAEVGAAPELTVVDPGWAEGDLYAGGLVVDPSGEWLYIVDGNWANNGGGLYRAPIDCETGALGAPELVVASKLGARLLLLREDPARGLLVAREVGGDDTRSDMALLTLADGATLATVDAFGDDDAYIGDAALSNDDRTAIITDVSEFSGVPTRVAVVAVDAASGALEARDVQDVEDPIALVASAHGDGFLVASGYGDALLLFSADADADPVLASLGEPDYTGGSPQLPSAMAQVRRGSLAGLVLVAEVEGVRLVQLGAGPTATDAGVTALGDSLEGIIGAVGVQP